MSGTRLIACSFVLLIVCPTTAHPMELKKRNARQPSLVDASMRLYFTPLNMMMAGAAAVNGAMAKSIRLGTHRLYDQPIPACDNHPLLQPGAINGKGHGAGHKPAARKAGNGHDVLMPGFTDWVSSATALTAASFAMMNKSVREAGKYADWIKKTGRMRLRAFHRWNLEGAKLCADTMLVPGLKAAAAPAIESAKVIAGKAGPFDAASNAAKRVFEVNGPTLDRASSAFRFSTLVQQAISDVGMLKFPHEVVVLENPLETLTFVPPDPTAAKAKPNQRPLLVETAGLAASSKAIVRFLQHRDGLENSLGLAVPFHLAGRPLYLIESKEDGRALDTRTPGQKSRDKARMIEAAYIHAGGTKLVDVVYCAETLEKFFGLAADPRQTDFLQRVVTLVGSPNPIMNSTLSGAMAQVPKSLIRAAFTFIDSTDRLVPHLGPFMGALDGPTLPSKTMPDRHWRPGWKSNKFANAPALDALHPRLAKTAGLTAWTDYQRLGKLPAFSSPIQQMHLAGFLFGLLEGQVPGLAAKQKKIAGKVPHIFPTLYDQPDGRKRLVSLLHIPPDFQVDIALGGEDKLIDPGSARRIEEALPNAKVHVVDGMTHTALFSYRFKDLPFDALNLVLDPRGTRDARQ